MIWWYVIFWIALVSSTITTTMTKWRDGVLLLGQPWPRALSRPFAVTLAHWQCALESRLFTRALIRRLVRAYLTACLAYIRCRKQFIFTNTCLQFWVTCRFILVTSDIWDGWPVPYFNGAVSAGAVMCAVAFGAFERFREEVIVWYVSQYCSGILLEELRKALNMSVRFY